MKYKINSAKISFQSFSAHSKEFKTKNLVGQSLYRRGFRQKQPSRSFSRFKAGSTGWKREDLMRSTFVTREDPTVAMYIHQS
jgi:hypothetical protein